MQGTATYLLPLAATIFYLIGVAGGALDLGRGAQVLRLGEPLQAAVQRDGAAAAPAAGGGVGGGEDGGQVERDVPEGVDRRRDVLARLKERSGGYFSGFIKKSGDDRNKFKQRCRSCYQAMCSISGSNERDEINAP